MGDLQTTFGLSAVISIVLQMLKNSPYFPLLKTETDKLNRFAMIVLTGLATLGITVQCNWTAHDCLVAGLDWHVVLPGLWHWFVQAVSTHGFYKLWCLTKVATKKD